ncbi:hypothetical protein COT87_00355 [Candidatus Collierbacteria bacterium CG10_big_fil_rev_8_21_14_0_10_44_9]|uniref:Peptidase C39-like domain-containing protein n=1 Tax=Candidatus Collierbacteria bacterium CG10_big_fil_rev_8_21_14_0_10_44_9 TaxID=1974535 RepID=A0A2H0VJJ8_9BACT|nr:MAG: hypothetical protein COT87_00355 [Candidatus Collierbacteria bacterium CG10_big_fil_rev_8_21_14_0_10_44_9]
MLKILNIITLSLLIFILKTIIPDLIGDTFATEQTYQVNVIKFQDKNQNSLMDEREWPIQYWDMKLFKGNGCEGSPISEGQTKIGGVRLTSNQGGEHSVLEAILPSWADENYPFDWLNTTGGACQNVLLEAGKIPQIKFGNYPILRTFFTPYVSQKDPLWSSKEYDHGNTTGPFFCGTTIGGCGCAITSAAMVLVYLGVGMSPNGDWTNPDSLNTWLKENNGYAFGALKWNSIAAYSVKTYEIFGTTHDVHKVRFVGVGSANNYSLLDTDLASYKPVILEEPGHFIVGKEKQDTTYAINDPAFENKTTLASYNNSFLSMRRFEKTNTDLSSIYISTPAPNDLLITDSQGRKAGKDPQTGQTFSEIPNSYYFLEPSFADQSQENPQTPQEGQGVNMLVIINPDLGSYNLNSSQASSIDFSSYDRNGDISVKEFSTNSSENFGLDYSPEPGYQFHVYQNVQIEIEGGYPKKAGVVPVILKSGKNFDIDEVDLSTLLFAQTETSKDKANLVSTGKDSKKDLKVFFDAKIIDWTKDWCLTGQTITQTEFKGCSP